MASQPRRRRLRRLGKALLVGVLSLAALSIAVQTDLFSRAASRLLERILAGATHERAVVGGVRLDLVGRRAVVEGLVLSEISDDPAKDGQTILAADRVQVVVGMRAWRPNLRLLELDHPVLRLHLDEDGLREFRDIPPGQPQPEAGGPAELPWERLRVVNGEFSLLGPRFSIDALGLYVSPDQDDLLDVDVSRLALESGGVAQVAHDVRLRQVAFSPTALQIPALSMAFEPERGAPAGPSSDIPGRLMAPGLRSLSVEGQLSAARAGPLSGDLRVEGRLEGWNAALPENLAMTGALAADVRLSGTTEVPLIGGALALTSPSLVQRKDDGALVSYEPGDIATSWRLDGRVLSLGPLQDSVAGGALGLNATLDLGTLGVSASVTGEGLSFAQVLVATGAAQHPWVDFVADLEAEVAGTLDPLQIAGSFDVALMKLAVTAGPVADPRNDTVLAVPSVSVDGELRLDSRRIRLIAHRVQSGGTRGSADATIGLSGGGPLDVSTTLDPVDLRLLRPLSDVNLIGVGRLEGSLRGPFSALRAEGHLTADGFWVLDIPFADRVEADFTSDLKHLDFPRINARKGRSRYSGSVLLDFSDPFQMDINLLLNDATIADISGMFLDIPGLDGHLEGTLSLLGDPYALDGEGDLTLDHVDLWGEPFDRGSARAWMDHGRFTLDQLELTRADGAESVLARGTVGAGWAEHFEIVTGGLRLEHLALLPENLELRGALGIDIVADGTLFVPEPRGRVAVDDTWMFGQRVGDSSLRFSTTDGVLSWSGNVLGPGLAVAGTLGLWDQQPYTVAAVLNDLPLHAIYPVAADGSPITALVSGRVDLAGTFGDTPTPVDLTASLTRVALSWRDHELVAPSPWRYTQHGSTFQLDEIRLAGGSTSLRMGGWRAEDGRLAFAGDGKLDLDLLRAVVPGLTRAEGVADVNLSAFGAPGEPAKPVVDVVLSDATIRGDWFPASFEGISGTLSGGPDGYDVADLSGRLGGGTIEVAGRIDASGWLPTRYDLSADVSGARVQYLDYLPPFLGDAHLSFDGPADRLLLGGTIDVRSMQFVDRIDWEQWVLELANERLTSTSEEATADYFDLDLHIHADDTLRVRNNVGDLSGSADLSVIGDTSRPGLLGTVRLDPGGRVYFKEREFDLARGEIRFNEPYAYDPDLDIALETTVKSREETYDIDMRVSGPYSNWNTSATAYPSLSQSDINALLLFGMTQEELERYGGLPAALALEGGDLLASRFGILERVGSGVFKLDLFKLDRVDLISGVSERGSGVVSSEIRLLAEKDLGWDTTLILEQNLSRTSDTYIGFDKQLARTLYARAYWASQQYGRSLAIGGAYGLDVNLRWELF